MFNYDELSIYRGRDIEIANGLTVTQPTLGQIEEFGEERYFAAIHNLTSVGADLKWQLWDMGIDYTQIDDYDLFIGYTRHVVGSKKPLLNLLTNTPEMSEELSKYSDQDQAEMEINPLELILKDIDFSTFKPYTDKSLNQPVLYDEEKKITFNRCSYIQLVDIVRKMHGLTRNNELPANETTKMVLIEDARDEAMAAKDKPFKSPLLSLISALINHPGFKYGHAEVWDMKINAFFDSIKRINKIQDAQLLIQSAYSGFADLKSVDKDRLNWAGDI